MTVTKSSNMRLIGVSVGIYAAIARVLELSHRKGAHICVVI